MVGSLPVLFQRTDGASFVLPLLPFFFSHRESTGTLLRWVIYMYANRLLMYLNLGRCSKESYNSTEMGLLKALSSSFLSRLISQLLSMPQQIFFFLMPIKPGISIKTGFKVSRPKIKNNIEWTLLLSPKTNVFGGSSTST